MPVQSAKRVFANYLVYTVVCVIGLLLLVNAFLLYENSRVIERNRAIQAEAERIKVNTLDIVRNLHQVDMGLRGYFLLKNVDQKNAVVESSTNIKAVFSDLEQALSTQQFPMDRFHSVRDSVLWYYDLVDSMLVMIENKDDAAFMQLLKENHGYYAWKSYFNFSNEIAAFENDVAAKARINYDLALRNSYLLQVVLFLITVPAMLYMAYYTLSAFKVSEQLRMSEAERAKILAQQNENLERMVSERTNEILAQNEEISSHNEQLRVQRNEIENQNRQLVEAKKTIEHQHDIIRMKNEELIGEVQRQTKDLKETNAELIEHNSRLEQFTYIISHNLRAPMARLVGLSTILDYAPDDQERADIVQLMVKSTSELDHVIRDLSQILAIQKLSTHVFSEINLQQTMAKVLDMLDLEIVETRTTICLDLVADKIYSLPQYIESILFNLVSNAIKYRNPLKRVEITVEAKHEGERLILRVSDNGLGIDLDKHKHSLFNLYKRFHFHVEGKGLGLYLVRTQVEAIGGDIRVESKVDQGTTFIMTF